MGARRISVALAAALAASAFAATPASAAAPLFCKPGDRPCTRITVPIDRSGAVPGVLNLQVERRKARKPTRPPLVVLAGGPGQSATLAYSAQAFTQLLGRESRARDVYVFDQRGTGRSGAIACTPLQKAETLRGAVVERCAQALGARRGFFQTRDSVDDIDAIRRALGLQKIALLGTSYGTRVALAYATAHPDHVDRLVLNSVVPPDGGSLLGEDTLAASPRLVRGICDGRCRGFTRDPVADVRRLAARLARRPLTGRVVSTKGRARKASLSLEGFVGLFLAGDFNPVLRTALPGTVRSALNGDSAPLLRLAAMGDQDESIPDSLVELSTGAFVATICEETPLPWPATATTPAARLAAAERTIAALPASAFGAFPRQAALVAGPLDLCRRWPLSGRAAEPPAPARFPAVPTLLLSGGRDARTPVEDARALAARIPGSRLLVADRVGHDVLGSDTTECAARGLRAFLAGARPAARCPGGANPRPSAPPPASISQVKPPAGLRGRPGRTAGAVRFGVQRAGSDLGQLVVLQLVKALLGLRPSTEVRVGGLRRGYAALNLDNGRLSFHAFSEVPGVTVAGTFTDGGGPKGRGRLRVSGRAASKGTLVVRRRVARGRLGGRTVRFKFDTGVEDALSSGASASHARAVTRGWR